MIGIEDDGIAVLACADQLDGLAMTADGNAPLKQVLGQGCYSKRVALDLGQTGYIDSAAIGWLLSSHKAFKDAGGRLVIHSLQPGVKRVIDMMRLGSVLELAPNQAHALQQLRGS
ncbi:MAG: STAS domain-containing protein [Phycisphaerales bacterium JB063]